MANKENHGAVLVEVGSSSVDEDGNPSAVTLENKRRPMLEDQDWCNNIMSTDENGSDCAQPVISVRQPWLPVRNYRLLCA